MKSIAPDWNPLEGSPPAEIALPDAPLVRVIAQIRFPMIVSINDQSFVGPFQEAIRHSYPFADKDGVHQISVSGAGVAVARVQNQGAWRFQDAKRHWRVSLAPDYLALETDAYLSRADFLGRFQVLLKALADHIRPTHVDRIGLRYIDRVKGVVREELAGLVRAELLGVVAGPLGAQTTLSVSEHLFSIADPKAQLRARWALLPPNSTIDPTTLNGCDTESWVLDLDMFSVAQTEFDATAVLERVERFAERSYSCFRWAVTDDFLRKFGGEI